MEMFEVVQVLYFCRVCGEEVLWGENDWYHRNGSVGHTITVEEGE